MHAKNKINVITSIFSQAIILLLGFIIPRLIISNYGSDTNGVVNTLVQVFAYLALLEAGIGQATKNALFPYINKKTYDKTNISEVMYASKKYYRKVTFIYGVVVIILACVLPYVLKTDLDYLTIALTVIFEGAAGVISFYYIQGWSMLLVADGKNYVVANIDLLTRIISYGVKIILATLSVNIVILQFAFFCVTLLKLIIYAIYTKRSYPWIYQTKVAGTFKLEDRNAYVANEVAWAIFSSTDLIILSVFCSTKLSSVYSIYNMIFIAINNMLNSIFNGLIFNLGQTYHKDIEEYKRLHDLFNSVFIGGVTILMCVSLFLTLPFVSLYTDNITDINYIYKSLPIMFCLIQIMSWSRYVSGNLTGVAGYAKKVSKVSIIEALTNVILSIILVQIFDIKGVLFATVAALPLKAIYCNWLSDTVILRRPLKRTLSILGINYLTFAVACIISLFVNINISSYISFLFAGMILTVLFSIIIIMLNCMVNKDVISLLKRTFKK